MEYERSHDTSSGLHDLQFKLITKRKLDSGKVKHFSLHTRFQLNRAEEEDAMYKSYHINDAKKSAHLSIVDNFTGENLFYYPIKGTVYDIARRPKDLPLGKALYLPITQEQIIYIRSALKRAIAEATQITEPYLIDPNKKSVLAYIGDTVKSLIWRTPQVNTQKQIGEDT